MTLLVYAVALLALVGVPHEYRERVAITMVKTIDAEPPRDRPSLEEVAAIIEHESAGRPFVCREDQGGASRGLMQIWRPHSWCGTAVTMDDSQYQSDYDPATNVRRGIQILAADRRWHRKHCKKIGQGRHHAIAHFAGRGSFADGFARWVLKRAPELKRMVLNGPR